jgi:undecaprenyl-diphosphatase
MEFDILYTIDNLHNPVLDKIMVAITSLGNAGLIWIAIAVFLLFIKKTRKCGVLMLVSMILGLIIGNGFLKNIIARDRPCWIDTSIPLLIPNPHDYSFPSGHTLASFEAAVMIFLHNKKWGAISLMLALVIAFSRMYLFVHFPTDILGGMILGTVISLVVYYSYEKIKNRKQNIEKEVQE